MIFQLTPHSIYTNSGNSFSRAFLLEENYRENKNLLVFDTKKEAEAFAKVLSFVTKEPVFFLSNLAQVVDFFERDKGWYLVTKELFEIDINWKYHAKKYSFCLERNMDISPEACITKLIDLGYVHSVHLSKPGSYKKDGDAISIRLPFEEKTVVLSFFDTIVDEILLFDTHGQFIEKKEHITLPSLVDTR